ncbi:Fis family transcriptional regulator [Candidatus Protofrankia californiensis]|uniref:Fis family transcriptional regulator n=1 Tax=Candidatus Protofrankia californiensis TaxID=1839754 RepID=A0A1C3PAR1_9ACTN|nr:Fis family transcriptional regulator [Candidatus Protofrankia californiensis]
MADRNPIDQSWIASERERFLSHAVERDIHVRRMIRASWFRSRESNVDINRICVPYVAERDLETPLERSSGAILTKLHEQLQDESVSIILTDRTGLVLDRRCSGTAIADSLDRVQLAPGFTYAEQFAGTNGIGTTLSSGAATLVAGREHYTTALGQFACAGAPIRHPTSRKVVGVLDLTSWSATSGPLLMALATASAAQIENELRAQTGLREIALFEDYLAACRQAPGPVLALNGDVVMTNEHLRAVLDSAEQQALANYAADTLSSMHRPAQRTVDLPGGRIAHLKCTPISSEAGPAGGVFRIRLGAASERSRRAAPGSAGRPPLVFPGLVGSAAAWVRSVAQINSCYEAGEMLAVRGEPGTGKRAILRAVHTLHQPARSFRLVDPPCGNDDQWLAELAESLRAPGGMVVLVHAEQLTEETSAAVGELLAELAESTDAERRVRLAITVATGDVTEPLAALFPRSIEVPPLRYHTEDIAELVPYLLERLSGGSRLTVSAATMSQLARAPWPGNIEQLRGVLKRIVKVRHSGVIEVSDLPPEGLAAVRRVLSPLESLERDAIVTALLDNDENPTRAAAAVGMSRATIYRKLRQYGITLPLHA